MRISHKLLRIAEARVQMIRDELEDCHPDDFRRREHLTTRLREAELMLQDKLDMVAAEGRY